MSHAGALDRLLIVPSEQIGGQHQISHALATASAAIARLDQALSGHPLRQAFLFRARLDAVRRQAATDGARIDPWQLAASVEGLKFRVDPYLRIAERGIIFDAARTALNLHQWLTETDFDQEFEVQKAEAELALHVPALPPLLAAAKGFWIWIDRHQPRAAMRVALVRFWSRHNLLRLPIPLTGTAALSPEVSWEFSDWVPVFLRALEREAMDSLDLLFAMERAWYDARRAITGRRSTSHAAATIDVLAATPVISATTLAGIIGIAVKNAIRLLEELRKAGIVIEVTHRSKRRLFGLAGLAPLREVVSPPYRPERGRIGRPRYDVEEPAPEPVVASPAPLSPFERRHFDYSALEEAMSHLDDVVRRGRQALAQQKQQFHAGLPQQPENELDGSKA